MTNLATVGAVAQAPSPKPDVDSAFYWSGLREKRLLLQKCTSCRRCRFPAMPACPYCAAPDADIIQASGRGTIYSWIVVHHAFDPAFKGEVPYTLATIDFAEGGRTVGRLEGETKPNFGQEVGAVFVDHPDWTELRFRAA